MGWIYGLICLGVFTSLALGYLWVGVVALISKKKPTKKSMNGDIGSDIRTDSKLGRNMYTT